MRTLLRALTGLAVAALLALPPPARAGAITAYTALEEDDVKVYLDAFAKEVPDVKVNVLRLSTGDLAARILAEKSNPRHDVIWGVAVTNVVDPRLLEMAEPYKPKGIDEVKTIFKDPQHRWFATTGYFAGFCVNTEVLKKKNLPMPASWQDLTKPIYKGEVVMPNAASSGTGYLQIASILQMKGEEEGWKLLKELDKNMAQYIKSGSRPCRAAAAGEYAIGASFAFSAVKQIQQGYPIKLVIPSEGAGYEIEVSSLMKTSQNKADARRFLDWLLTPTAAKLYDYPATRFVAEFIGRMNVLRLDGPAGGPTGLGGVPLQLPVPARVVGIRPEDVELADGGAGATNEVVGTVRKVVFLGSVTHVTLAVGDQTLLVELGGAERLPERGAQMAVRLPPERLRPLDETTA